MYLACTAYCHRMWAPWMNRWNGGISSRRSVLCLRSTAASVGAAGGLEKEGVQTLETSGALNDEFNRLRVGVVIHGQHAGGGGLRAGVEGLAGDVVDLGAVEGEGDGVGQGRFAVDAVAGERAGHNPVGLSAGLQDAAWVGDGIGVVGKGGEVLDEGRTVVTSAERVDFGVENVSGIE